MASKTQLLSRYRLMIRGRLDLLTFRDVELRKLIGHCPQMKISLSFFIVSTVPPDERTIRFQQTYFVVARQSSIRA